MGVFLFAVIQTLCEHERSNNFLYLQCDHTKQPFSRFITIGFWYSIKHYLFYSIRPEDSKKPYPFCSKFGELPFALFTLAGKGEICYKIVLDTQNENIRLLTLKKSLATWFPPSMPITDHPLLTEWLFSVPFPIPQKFTPWNNSKEGSVLQKVRKFFSRECREEDKKWSPEKDCSLNPLQSCQFINVAVDKKVGKELSGRYDMKEYGSNIIIQHSLPFVDVKKLDVPESKPDHYSWFLAVQATLYSNTAAFEAAEWKACFLAFRNRYRLVDESLGFSRMWLLPVPVSHRNDVWGYWNQEGDKLFVTGPCNDFYFDLFRKMLFHTGFQNGDKPFYIGYVTAEVNSFMNKMKMSSLHICFRPSWRRVKHKGPICYIGKKNDTYYPISPRDFDSKRYILRKGVYERQAFCVVHETEWPRDDSDGESSVESSVLDEGEEVDEDGEANNNTIEQDGAEQVVQEEHMSEGDYDGEAIEKQVLVADAISIAEAKNIEDQVAQDEQIEAHEKDLLLEPMDGEARQSKAKDNVDKNDVHTTSEAENDADQSFQKDSTMAVQIQDSNSQPNENHETEANDHANPSVINEEIETFAPSSPEKTADGEESIDTDDGDDKKLCNDKKNNNDDGESTVNDHKDKDNNDKICEERMDGGQIIDTDDGNADNGSQDIIVDKNDNISTQNDDEDDDNVEDEENDDDEERKDVGDIFDSDSDSPDVNVDKNDSDSTQSYEDDDNVEDEENDDDEERKDVGDIFASDSDSLDVNIDKNDSDSTQNDEDDENNEDEDNDNVDDDNNDDNDNDNNKRKARRAAALLKALRKVQTNSHSEDLINTDEDNDNHDMEKK